MRKKRTKTQRRVGGALARRKARLVDKIAEGVSMFLAGHSPSFAKLGIELVGQATKGIKDNVDHYRRQKGGWLNPDFFVHMKRLAERAAKKTASKKEECF